MGAHIKPEGWHNWDKQESERTTRYCEYNSSGPGANDAGRRAPWSNMLRTEEAEIYSIANVLSGNDGWNPETDNISRGVTMPRINVFLAGDSTVSGNHAAPMEGWGEVLQSFMNGDVTVHNEAFSGRSSKSFIDEGRLDQIEANIGSGDYLLIQFGHNDQKPDEERRTEPFSTYKSYLKRYIDVARSKEAVPVLISSVQRRKFDEHGNHLDTHGDYPMAMKQLAEECDVPFIDLDVRSKALLESLGPEQSKSLFVWLEPGESLNYPDGIQDDTHFSEYGAKQMAQLVIEAIEQLRLPLSAYIVK
jgi:lysophospholipase L1-like esterase